MCPPVWLHTSTPVRVSVPTGRLPTTPISIKHRCWEFKALTSPEMVPVPRRSPVPMPHMAEAWWASCCIGVQYRYLKLLVAILCDFPRPIHQWNEDIRLWCPQILESRHIRIMVTLNLTSNVAFFSSFHRKCSRGAGSCLVLTAHLKGSRASKVMTQHDIDVPKPIIQSQPFWSIAKHVESKLNEIKYLCNEMDRVVSFQRPANLEQTSH